MTTNWTIEFSSINNSSIYLLTVCIITSLLGKSEIKAQEPVAPYGKFVTAKGLKLYYEETGKDMPLLLLHVFGRIHHWGLDALHIHSLNVLGHSSGGFISLYMATIRPQMTKKIFVVSGQLYYSNTTRSVITSLGEPEKNFDSDSGKFGSNQTKSIMVHATFCIGKWKVFVRPVLKRHFSA